MSFETFEFVQSGSQEGRTRLSHKESFVERFLDGTINIAIDIGVKDVDELVRVWIARHSEHVGRAHCFDLELQIIGQEGQTNEVGSVLADMAVENGEGINKGRLCRTWWQSMIFSSAPNITPPFWWPTGNSRSDPRTMIAQGVKYGRNGSLTPPDNLFRYQVGADLLDAIRSLRLAIDQFGLAIPFVDDRIEIVNAIYGPFT